MRSAGVPAVFGAPYPFALMAAAAMESRLQFHLLFWYGVVAVAALLLSSLMASDLYAVSLLVAGIGWLVLLPYHAQIALRLSLITFNSALILPFMPGRPRWWEFAALLAWTGVPITIFLRRYPKEFGRTLRQQKWLFVGSAFYCAVLVVIMMKRGVGFRIFGSEQMGGRFYATQLLCSIFPLLFCVCRITEKQFTRLFVLQWLLTATYLISDFVFAYLPANLFFLLNFFELPNDAFAFEVQSLRFGIRRFQSLGAVGPALIAILLIRYNLRDFVGKRSVWLLPLTAAILGISLVSGHRWVILILSLTLFFSAYAQRFFSIKNILLVLVVLGIGVAATYSFGNRMPQAFQRAVSFLPGLDIDPQAAVDAASTITTRRVLFKIGLDLIPEYFWLGRGFGRFMDDYTAQTDGISAHLNQGVFYNGFIGLMINTGFPGFVAMIIFFVAGLKLAWNIVRHIRRYGCEDSFSRTCALVASMYVSNVLAFLFLHGDAEWALKTFSLQVGMLIACWTLLRARLEQSEATEAPPAAV